MTLPEEWPSVDEAELLDGEVEVGYEDGDDEPDYFARVMYYVLDFPGLGRVGKDAYVCLVRGLGWGRRRRKMTREQLAAVMSISTDTFDRGVKELVKHGLVEVNRRRDSSTGNWATSSYLLKDTKSAQMRARIVELEQALGKRQPKTEAKPQVSTSPQNAARTEPDNSGGDEGHRSADCGMDVTSEDTTSPQVATSPQNAEPPGRNLRNRRAADCGHRRENSLEREEQREEKDLGLPAVGGPTRRTARAREAPAAQPGISIQAQTLLAELRRYRGAPGWARQRHLLPMAAQALDRFGRDAVVRYAVMVAAEERFEPHQHIPEFREALRRLGRDVQLGDACALDGLDPAACPCDSPTFPPPDRPWTQDDQTDWERVLERLGVADEDLGAAAEG
ncbi:hypothetical protein JOL79_07045 [Microbispora sp. RL4-1S]|uniref:Helix-turn-helix domain-containing protein n=1 Tax=Microbispora oryzae TaxID=2806554 RepID=A0A941AH09_9ACTN|nr:hypothetical protein [Microbispora oryzae]MBP2703555.1 hypothetical protein [Microbispora oryzae]